MPQNAAPVALVTGASRGIGRAIAVRLAQEAYRVTINYRSNADAARQTAQAVHEVGGQADIQQADVGQEKERQQLMARTLEKWGRLDLLVNNAGITSPGRKDLLEIEPSGWETVMRTNLQGPFFLSQLAARHMMDQIRSGSIPHGWLVNISSISSYAVSTNRGDYCLAKAALHMMTQLFADRLAYERIQVFEICPGIIESDMTAPVREKYDRLLAEGLAPMRRWGTPQDVAEAVAAIVVGAFPYSTGMRIDVDGGFHLRRL